MTTTPDPQFSTFKLLRPFEGFAAVYTGAASNRPIMFTEVMPSTTATWGNALDPENAVVNSARLLAGLKVPLASRLLMWLPKFTWNGGTQGYRWVPMFRLRSMLSYKRGISGYHFPMDFLSAGGLDVMPACDETIPYIQTEPAGELARSVTNLRTEDLHNGASDLLAPFTPTGGNGIVQQGLTMSELPSWQWHETQSKGDELLLGLYRDTAGGVWDFAATDLALVTNLSGPNIGALVSYGIAP